MAYSTFMKSKYNTHKFCVHNSSGKNVLPGNYISKQTQKIKFLFKWKTKKALCKPFRPKIHEQFLVPDSIFYYIYKIKSISTREQPCILDLKYKVFLKIFPEKVTEDFHVLREQNSNNRRFR